jgi:hypothetical protein
MICAECGVQYEVQIDRRGDTEAVGLCVKCRRSLLLEMRPRPQRKVA